MINFVGQVYIAVGRIATADMVAADVAYQAELATNESMIPIDANGQRINTSWTVPWNGYLFSRNFSSGYMFRVVSKACYYMDDLNTCWTSEGMKPETEISNRYVLQWNELVSDSATSAAPPHISPPSRPVYSRHPTRSTSTTSSRMHHSTIIYRYTLQSS
jgi:hypothetical protein